MESLRWSWIIALALAIAEPGCGGRESAGDGAADGDISAEGEAPDAAGEDVPAADETGEESPLDDGGSDIEADAEVDLEVVVPDLPAGFFVVPPITNEKILPDSVVPEDYRSCRLRVTACPGELEPASFVISAEEDLHGVEVEPGDLAGPGGALIPAASVDVRVVKCWWQAGSRLEDHDPSTKLLTPELLLKDDTLVRVEGGENYVRAGTEEVWVSEWDTLTDGLRIPVADFPVEDASELLPVDVPAGTSKQFWITVRVPEGAVAGDYEGALGVHDAAGAGGALLLSATVLPFALGEPMLTYGLYYSGHVSTDRPEGSISDYYKSEEQFGAEMRDMHDHGVDNPTLLQRGNGAYIPQMMALRNEAGMLGSELFDHAVVTQPGQEASVLADLAGLIERTAPYGVTDVYVYGIDEARDPAVLLSEVPVWEAVHEAGGKVFASGRRTSADNPQGPRAVVGEHIDAFVCAGEPDAAEASGWHDLGHRIFAYACPQGGVEEPETYRRNFGLLLWQRGYDGEMDFAYQWALGSIWNDFDSDEYRDHNFTYPTASGVIDTIQWEGFREAVDDVRYLTVLLELRDRLHGEGVDTSTTDAWIEALKGGSLDDLDAIRSDMIDRILCLLAGTSC
jgi:hypothetical protein